jgi:ubiquitin C-terminal hydrolase
MQSCYINNKKLIIPPIGFRNTGSICYFNSLMQCLLSSKQFIEFMLDINNQNNKKEVFTDFFRHIVDDKWNVIFTTKLLVELNGFSPNQSSSEYFVKIVDDLSCEKLFECKYKISMKCLECGYAKSRHDISYNVLINQSFDEFFGTKSDLEDVLCDGCKKKTLHVEERMLANTSNMIAISFNKYFQKHVISYPERFIINQDLYQMVGSIEHFGVLNAGHYVARGRRVDDDDENCDNYFIFDDERVIPIDDKKFSNPMGETYMIFYEKVNKQ